MKILVIEDEATIARYLKKGLELKQFIVDCADDGLAGLDLALSESYDVIVVDWMLPKIAGTDLIKTLRAKHLSTPILMLTAKDSLNEKITGLENGADDYLTKPFEFSEFIARIQALARRSSSYLNAVYSYKGLIVDTNSAKVSRSNKTIALSKKEFALLEFLIRHQGQVFSKDDLTQHVWEFESDVLPNTAQVYIGYLRNKIDKPFIPQDPLIHTVRGFGYKLE